MSKQRKGSRWAFFERLDIPDYDSDDGYYLRRIRIIQTPWFGVFLHRFDGPDSRPTLHDHPYNFLSFVLKGGYVERRLNLETYEVDEQHSIRFANYVRTCDAHAIMTLLRVPTYTLLFVGRRVRKWGYWEPTHERATDGRPFHTWRWTPFDKHLHAFEFDEALKQRQTRKGL